MSQQAAIYQEFNDVVTDLNLTCDASELHGFISGCLSISGHLGQTQEGLQQLFNLDATQIDTIKPLIILTLNQLNGEGLNFQLALPDQEQQLDRRATALASWAQGFISGLGEGGLDIESEDSQELKEILNDMVEISQIQTDYLDDSDEENSAFTELEEYLRVAAMTIYADLLLENQAIADTIPDEQRQ